MAELQTEKPFMCSYDYEDQTWGLTIFACSAAEAEHRLKAIGRRGRVEGELADDISAPRLGLLDRFCRWLLAAPCR